MFEISGNQLKYNVLILLIIFTSVLLSYASTDYTTLTTREYTYIMAIVIPLVLGLLYVFVAGSSSENMIGVTNVLIWVGFIVVIVISMMIYFYSNMSFNAFIFSSYLTNIFIFIIILIGLIMIYKTSSNYLKNLQGWPGFFINLIFYLPCLAYDYIAYLFREGRNTPNIVYILFIIEILLILGVIYIPKFVSYILNLNGIMLLSSPVFLNVITSLDKAMSYEVNGAIVSYSQIVDKSVYGITSAIVPVYRTNYSITMWIYLNPQPNSNASYKNETAIFTYGDNVNHTYHPKLTYSNNVTGSNEKPDTYLNAMYNVYYSNMNYVPVSAPFQRWNYFVFNYNLNGVDIFVNGELTNSLIFNQNDIPTYSNLDTFTAGSDNGFIDADKGLDGSICNIHYYQTPLTKYQIVSDYNLLMTKNPPIHI
jgi:hypothetical protein